MARKYLWARQFFFVEMIWDERVEREKKINATHKIVDVHLMTLFLLGERRAYTHTCTHIHIHVTFYLSRYVWKFKVIH
jgi:adenine-specific DNA glycosylase